MMQPLSAVCEIIMGQAPSGDTYNEDRVGLPLIAGASDFGKITPKPTRFTSAAAKISRANDIILCVRATIGDLNWSDSEYCLGRGVAGLRVNEQKADRNYIWRALEHGAARLSALGRGATFKQISKPDIANFEIPLPTLDEQKRIAAILDQADELRRKRQLAINHLNQLGQAIFYEMFGDPKMNPHGFPTIALGDLIKVSSGSGLIGSDQKGGEYPVYGGNGVNGWHDDFTVPAGTIVIGRVGVYCGAVHVTDRSAWVTDNALVVSLKQPVNQTYLAAALKIADLNQYAGRSAQPLVSGSRIYPIEILNPPINRQKQYDSRIQRVEMNRTDYSAALRASNKLFSALQQSAFQGEL